ESPNDCATRFLSPISVLTVRGSRLPVNGGRTRRLDAAHPEGGCRLAPRTHAKNSCQELAPRTRAKKTVQTNRLSPGADPIRTEKDLAQVSGFVRQSG